MLVKAWKKVNLVKLVRILLSLKKIMKNLKKRQMVIQKVVTILLLKISEIKNQFRSSEEIFCQIFCSRGRPVEKFYWTSSRFQGTSNRNSTGRPVKFFIEFLDEISNSKTFEANLQNSIGRPVESYWTSSRIQRTSNRSSTGRPLDQMIWAIVKHQISKKSLA